MDATRDERTDAQRAARLATTGVAVQAGLALVALGAAIASGSLLGLGVAAHVGAGALAWGAGALLARRRKRAAEERAEDDRLARSAEVEGRRPLFLAARDGQAPASEARLGAALAIGLALVEGALAVAIVLAGRARAASATPGTEAPLEHLLGGAAALAGSSFLLLLLAKFSLALASGERAPAGSPLALATAGSRRAASAALAAFAGAVVLALLHIAPTLRLDPAGYAFAGIEGLLAVELLLSLVLELYRPRKKDDLPRPAYESRLLALFAEPGGVARSFARAVDYQFGFQLSETWAYALVERGMAPLVAFFAGSFWLLSCFVVVPQGETALLERLGTRTGELGPGLHVKLPWPLESIESVAVERVRTVVLGGATDEHDDAKGRLGRVVLWTEEHGEGDEFLLLVARPDASLDLLEARVHVSYVVANAVEYARGAAAPERFLKALGERELARIGCSHGLEALLGPGREQAALDLRARIQKSADEHALGVRILAVGLEDLHPPVAVAKDFHAETAALEEAAAKRLQGKADAAQLAPRAEGEARAVADRAKTEAAQRRLLAESEGRRFRAALSLDRAAPRAYRQVKLLRTLEEALAASSARRIVLPAGSRGGSVDLDLGEKLTTDDLGVEATPEGKK